MTRPGAWNIVSETDPRWNAAGRAQYLSAFYMPEEVTVYIKRKTKELGPPPEDLMYSCIKD